MKGRPPPVETPVTTTFLLFGIAFPSLTIANSGARFGCVFTSATGFISVFSFSSLRQRVGAPSVYRPCQCFWPSTAERSLCLHLVGTHNDDSDCERHSSPVVRQVCGRRLGASRSVEKLPR